MVTSPLLLAFLFLAGFLNVFFYFPRNKFHAWLQSFFPNNTPKAAAAAVTQPQVIPVKERRDSNTAELKRVFATFDKNGDGFITKQELRDSLKNIRLFMTEKEVEDMVIRVDANGDGLIDFDEFCILCQAMDGGCGGGGGGEECGVKTRGGDDGEDELKEAFNVFDKDRDGLISFEELGSVLCSLGLKEGNIMEDCKAMIRKVDMDGDGMVNFDEFKKMMKTGGGGGGGGQLVLISAF